MDKYSKTTWVNGQTPLNATNLNKIEGALEEISQEAIDGTTAAEKVDNALDSMHFSVAESSLKFTKDGEEKKISIPIGEMISEGVAGKLDKVTTNNGAPAVYAKDGEGEQYMIPFSANVAEWHIPYRVENGNLKVPLTPSADEMATSKDYVDKHSIKEISTQTVRLWDLDVGFYKLTYNGNKIFDLGIAEGVTFNAEIYNSRPFLMELTEVTNINSGKKRKVARMTTLDWNQVRIFYLEEDTEHGYDGGTFNSVSPIGYVNWSIESNIWAPVNNGQAGQILYANGDNNAPTWGDAPSGGGEEIEDYAAQNVYFNNVCAISSSGKSSKAVRLTNATPKIQKNNASTTLTTLKQNTILYVFPMAYNVSNGARYLYAYLEPDSPTWFIGSNGGAERNTAWTFYTSFTDAETAQKFIPTREFILQYMIENSKLNGVSLNKQISYTVSFFAPTTGGTSGRILKSNGSIAEPTWTDIKTINGESILGTGDITVSGGGGGGITLYKHTLALTGAITDDIVLVNLSNTAITALSSLTNDKTILSIYSRGTSKSLILGPASQGFPALITVGESGITKYCNLAIMDVPTVAQDVVEEL